MLSNFEKVRDPLIKHFLLNPFFHGKDFSSLAAVCKSLAKILKPVLVKCRCGEIDYKHKCWEFKKQPASPFRWPPWPGERLVEGQPDQLLHFNQEAIELTQPRVGFGQPITFSIPRSGDLVHTHYLEIKLPGMIIYCKHVGQNWSKVGIKIRAKSIKIHYDVVCIELYSLRSLTLEEEKMTGPPIIRDYSFLNPELSDSSDEGREW